MAKARGELNDGVISLKRTIREYREVFGSRTGQRVLSHLIRTLGFFNADPGNDYARGQQDAAKLILRYVGVWEPENVDDMIEALMKISMKPGTPGYGG